MPAAFVKIALLNGVRSYGKRDTGQQVFPWAAGWSRHPRRGARTFHLFWRSHDLIVRKLIPRTSRVPAPAILRISRPKDRHSQPLQRNEVVSVNAVTMIE